MRAVTAWAMRPTTRRRFGRKSVHHEHDLQVAAFGHDARAAEKRHEHHEEDGKLLGERKGEIGQIADHHVGEGDEPQDSDGDAGGVFFEFEGHSGLGSLWSPVGIQIPWLTYSRVTVERDCRRSYRSAPKPNRSCAPFGVRVAEEKDYLRLATDSSAFLTRSGPICLAHLS